MPTNEKASSFTAYVECVQSTRELANPDDTNLRAIFAINQNAREILFSWLQQEIHPAKVINITLESLRLKDPSFAMVVLLSLKHDLSRLLKSDLTMGSVPFEKKITSLQKAISKTHS